MADEPTSTPTVPIVVNEATGEVETGEPRPALHNPGKYATPALWFLIVGSFSVIMVAAALSLMLEFLVPGAAPKAVEATVILLLFTNTAAFLSGLVIPSPFNRR